MCLKPILLKTSLTTILGRLALTLRTRIEWNELLFNFRDGLLSTLYLLLDDFLQWTHLIAAVRNVY